VEWKINTYRIAAAVIIIKIIIIDIIK